MLRHVLALTFMLLVFLPAARAGEVVVPVQVVATSSDSVGQRLVYQLKEGIRRSTRLDLTDDAKLGMQLSVVTLEGDRSSPGSYTIYSVVWSWNNPEQNLFPFYLTSSVGNCGSNRVQACAEDLVADTDEQSTRVIQLLKAVLRTSQQK